jgi:hypothetical protein
VNHHEDQNQQPADQLNDQQNGNGQNGSAADQNGNGQ